MTRKRWIVLVSVALGALVFVSALAFAQGRPFWRPGPFWGPGMGFGLPGLGRLNLTEDQRAEIRKILTEERARLRPAVEELRTLERELRKAIASEETATAHSLTGQLADRYRALLEARVALHQRIVQVLTPEQRQQLASWVTSATERPWRRRP